MGWMTISNFASKVLVFLMVPYYTRVLTTDGYGLYDLGYTAVTLLAPIMTANSGEALMRYSLVEKEKASEYYSAAFVASLAASVFSLAVGFIAPFFPLSANIVECVSGTALYLCANIQYTLFTQFARGIDRVKEMAIGGLVNSVVLFAASFVLMTGFHLGVYGCFVAGFLGCASGSAFIAISCNCRRYFTRPRLCSLRKLARYGMPLSVNSLGWWVNSSFTRYAAAFFCGTSGAGLLAAAYRIPSIPKAIQQIFIQAWQISSIKDFDSDDSDGFFGGVYNLTCWLSSLLTSFVISLIPLIAEIMFSSDFYEAWRYVPLLMLCIVFDCLASVIGGVFSAVGNTRPIALSAFVSVVVVVVASALLIPAIGVQGAALASVMSSIVIWAMRLFLSRSCANVIIDWRSFLSCTFVLVAQIALALILDISPAWYLTQALCFFVLLLCFFLVVVRPSFLS